MFDPEKPYHTLANTNIGSHIICARVFNSSAELATLDIGDILFLNHPLIRDKNCYYCAKCAIHFFFSFDDDDDSLRSSRHIRLLTTPHIDITCTITHNNVILYTSYYKSYNTQIYITYLLVGGRVAYTFRRNSVSHIYDIRI